MFMDIILCAGSLVSKFLCVQHYLDKNLYYKIKICGNKCAQLEWFLFVILCELALTTSLY